MQGSLFSQLAHRLQNFDGEVYPLHVGDTWMEPATGCRMQDLDVAEHPGMHKYAAPHGLGVLLDALVERVATRTGVPCERDEVLVAAGATGALGAVVGATIDPGDEVLLVAPYWPLIRGIVASGRGVPIDVPVIGEATSAAEAVAALEARITERSAAVYLSTPNNPTGRVLPSEWVEAIVEWAVRQGLWIYADEVYEDYVYAGEHRYCRSLAHARTFSVHSFSKAFGMAGNRCGYVAGPSEIMREVRKISVHSFYSTSTASQLAGARALDGRGDAWVAQARPLYMALGNYAADKLDVPPPEGSQFLFLDVRDHLKSPDEAGLLGFLERCAERGLFLAPGESFGPYPTHVRVCFTCAEPEVVRRGIDVFADILSV